MRRIGWYAVSASVVALVVGCVLLLAANLYVQSQVVQQRIRHALSAALRMPVSVRKTTVTPWDGLRIDGITAHPETDPSVPGDGLPIDYLLASSFRVRFALFPLFARGQVIIEEVLLDQPKVAWAQDDEGRWQLPPPPGNERRKADKRSRVKSSPPAPAAEPPADAPAAPPDVASALPSPAPSPPRTENPTPAEAPAKREMAVHSIDKVRLRHGNLAFLNSKHHQVGHFEEVDLSGHLPDLEHAAGTVGFGKASLPRVGLLLTNCQSDFTYGHDQGLTLSNARAALAGGDVTANCTLRTDEPATPFTLQCRLNNVGLGQLIREAGSRVKLIEGRLQGDLKASGLSDDPESRRASGQVQLLNARVKDIPIFRVLGEMLRIEDLSHMEFKQARLDYRLDGNVVQVDPLLLVSNDLRISAQGKYLTDDDRLDLHARLTVDEAVTRQLPSSVLQQFQPDADAPGSRYIEFNVTGPISKPNTNLYKRLLAPQVNDLLQSLLSKPKTPKEKFLKHPAPPTEPPEDGTEP